ncbi:DUF4065 domain-containing protein [Curvibacter sp. CHRR-16]|uniref:Panacea domain-containing protein n=1 Tax=Curvibacter sp. CHRR-16 TaxID=2835872 RepID=UPI001BDAB5FD|nr:type II toxin-antitoxin system antitoxin SocA domain-containing protein [Curvibacter sp. CHRR-16]MBT0569794.1 DUF4065 domain-containing protein [Curvibacter sp. CHRR-16]
MAYSAYAVANAFIQRAEEGKISNLTPMKLQKLLYFAQAWHLKGTNGLPVLDDHFARWKYGPVIPAIYHEFKAFGYQPITRKATTLSMNDAGYSVLVPMVPAEDLSTWGLIDAIINSYGSFDAQTLSTMTHEENSAWAQGNPDGSVITHPEILSDTTIFG